MDALPRLTSTLLTLLIPRGSVLDSTCKHFINLLHRFVVTYLIRNGTTNRSLVCDVMDENATEPLCRDHIIKKSVE